MVPDERLDGDKASAPMWYSEVYIVPAPTPLSFSGICVCLTLAWVRGDWGLFVRRMSLYLLTDCHEET